MRGFHDDIDHVPLKSTGIKAFTIDQAQPQHAVFVILADFHNDLPVSPDSWIRQTPEDPSSPHEFYLTFDG
jgi:hypothetical protein